MHRDSDSESDSPAPARQLSPAERCTPEMLQDVLVALERTESTSDVWRLIVAAGQRVGLPFVDFVSATGLQAWRPTLFVRTSYDSNWLQDAYADDAVRRWTYFRHHASNRLTPVLVGLEFADEFDPVPEARMAVLRRAAAQGLRAGFCVPLRQVCPPQPAMITFSGDHGKREMRAIVHAHGWALHAVALCAHQRYFMHFMGEFGDRNRITRKQLQLLALIGRGHRDKEIATELGVTISAVRQRMDALRQRTGLDSRAELATLAMSLGLLPDPVYRTDPESADTYVQMDGAGTRIRGAARQPPPT